MSTPNMQTKIADARDTLNRIIGFVGNCDSKVTTFLALVSVILTIFTTSDLAKEIFDMLVSIFKANTCYAYIFLTFIFANTCVFLYGVYKATLALKATVPLSGKDSKIYFADIAHNQASKIYSDKFIAQTEEEFLNDLLSQVYINAQICTKKYNIFNISMKIILCSFFVFISLISFGFFYFRGG